MVSEEKLIEGCLLGDRVAQRQLYEQYSSSFFALCLRYLPTRAEAEDVLIMGFTAIFEKMDTFKNEGSFEGWMKRVIVNTAISTIRANRQHYFRGGESEEMLENAVIATSPNSTRSTIDTKDILNQIQQLSDGYRTVFNLYAIEGYSYEEIATIMDINIGTVRSQLAKARKILQKKLEAFI